MITAAIHAKVCEIHGAKILLLLIKYTKHYSPINASASSFLFFIFKIFI